MINRSFIRVLLAGSIAFLLLTGVIVSSIVTRSSIPLLTGGVTTLPRATAFLPKQTVAMVSLQANPEQLYGVRQAALPLDRRRRDRQEWQQWRSELSNRLNLDDRQIEPWLGKEITLAVVDLDRDRNSANGMQPGYLLAMACKNPQSAREYLNGFYSESNPAKRDRYKGAEIISPASRNQTAVWANALVGDFVLFANNPQVIKESLDRAQAVQLNLDHDLNYRDAIAQIDRPHVALSYIDVPQTSAWLNKSPLSISSKDEHLTTLLSLRQSDLVARTALSGVSSPEDVSEAYNSLITNPELKQIVTPLLLKDKTDINLTSTASLSDRMPLYEVTRLAVKALFPHLEEIAIENQPTQSDIARTKMRFKLDT